MKFPENPILKRLIRRTEGPSWKMLWVLAGGLLLITLALFAWAEESLLSGIVFWLCPSVVLLALILAVSAALITQRETTSEPFQLLHLTNISSTKVVWGYIGGAFYRARLYVTLFVWACAIGILIVVLLARGAFRALPQVEDMLLIDMLLLLPLAVISGTGLCFLVIADAVAVTLRRRQAVVGIGMTVVSLMVMLAIGVILVLIFAPLIQSGQWVIVIAHGLVMIPLGLGIGLALYWSLDVLEPIIVSGYVAPVGLFLALFIRLLVFFVPEQPDVDVFWVVNAVIALNFIGITLVQWRTIRATRAVTLLAWQLIFGGLIYAQVTGENRQFLDVLLFVIIFVLLLAPYSFAFSIVRRARWWVWQFRF